MCIRDRFNFSSIPFILFRITSNFFCRYICCFALLSFKKRKNRIVSSCYVLLATFPLIYLKYSEILCHFFCNCSTILEMNYPRNLLKLESWLLGRALLKLFSDISASPLEAILSDKTILHNWHGFFSR